MRSLSEWLLVIIVMQMIHSCQQCNTNTKLDKLIELQQEDSGSK